MPRTLPALQAGGAAHRDGGADMIDNNVSRCPSRKYSGANYCNSLKRIFNVNSTLTRLSPSAPLHTTYERSRYAFIFIGAVLRRLRVVRVRYSVLRMFPSLITTYYFFTAAARGARGFRTVVGDSWHVHVRRAGPTSRQPEPRTRANTELTLPPWPHASVRGSRNADGGWR